MWYTEDYIHGMDLCFTNSALLFVNMRQNRHSSIIPCMLSSLYHRAHKMAIFMRFGYSSGDPSYV